MLKADQNLTDKRGTNWHKIQVVVPTRVVAQINGNRDGAQTSGHGLVSG
jgi:hypothetical protein